MSDGPNLMLLQTAKTDADVARDIRARADAALRDVCAIMDEAAAAGLVVQFDSLQRVPPVYRHVVVGLRVVKVVAS